MGTRGEILAYARDWTRSFLPISVATVLIDGHSLSFTVIPGDQRDQVIVCKVPAALSSSRVTHQRPASVRFHFPHTGLLPADSAKPIFTTLSSRKDGIYAQCDHGRTTCFKMDSRSYRKQHRRDEASVRKGTVRKLFVDSFSLGTLFGGAGMEPQVLCLQGRHSTSELYTQPHKQYKRQSGGGQDSNDQLASVNMRDAAARPGRPRDAP